MLRVAAVQAEAVSGAVAANVDRAVGLTAEAADAGARLVVFPEAFCTGYDAGVFAGRLPSLDDVAWLAPLQGVVDAAGVVVVLNTALERGDRKALTDVVLSPQRSPWAAYDKQHLHAGEVDAFGRGERGASFELDGVEIALSVCYDADFPEHAAAAAADGATVYVNSGAYFPGGARRRDLRLATRALDNGLFVVFSGLVGGPHDFIGGSAVFDPLGHRIAEVTAREGLAIADLDPEAVARAREQQRAWADRRESLGVRSRRAGVGRAVP